MKIEKFLKYIQHKLLNYPDINFITVKLFIQEFYNCLSKKEQIRYITECQLINEFTLKQISIDSFIQKTKVVNFENELNNLKNDKNGKN